MVAYIAFIASLNLCVGYALGVYFGVCPGLTPCPDEQETDDDEILGLCIADAPNPVESESEATAAVPLDTNLPEPYVEAEPATNTTNVATILAELGDFKAKLEQVSLKLTSATDDHEAINECAGEMKQANDDYLERTAEVIQSLNDEASPPTSGDDTLLRQKLHDQSEEVQRVNGEIECLATEQDQDMEQVRQTLLASSEQLTQTAAVIEYTLQGESGSSEAVANRAMGGLESMMALIDQEIADRAEDQPLVVAKLALKPAEGSEGSDASELLRGIASLVALELTSGQAMFTDPAGHLGLTLAGDNEKTAGERCERIRQRVASTLFRQGEQEVSADLMCSLTDTRKAARSNEVFSRLEAGLAKASDHATGCTVFHSAESLTIVAPSELAVEPQVVEL